MSISGRTLSLRKTRAWVWYIGFAAVFMMAAAIFILCLFNYSISSGIGDVLDLCMDMLGSLVCVLLFFGCMSEGDVHLPHVKVFVITLFLNTLTFFLDTVMWAVSGIPALRTVNLFLSTLFYVTDMMLLYEFWRYARVVLKLNGQNVNNIDLLLRILLIPGLLLCLGNLFVPVLFSISETGTYIKAPGYALGFGNMLFTFAILIYYLLRSRLSGWKKILSTLFALSPIAALVLTRSLPEIAVVYTVSSIAILLLNCVLFTERIRMKELIIRVFSFLLLGTMLICGPLLYRVSLRFTIFVGYERATGAFEMMHKTLDNVGLDNLSNPANTGLYRKTRDEMRALCRAFHLENLYVERIDPEDGKRYYIIVTAADDAADEIIRQKLGRPGASLWNEDSYITEPEKLAMIGKTSEIYSEQNNEYGHNLDWFCPYKDADGNVLALIGADFEVRSQHTAALEYTISNILPVLILYLATLIILILILGRTFIKPIQTISLHIENFLADGNPNTQPIQVWGGYEIAQLATSFEIMTSQMSDYEKKLKREAAERERISVELDLASSIQTNHLPGNFPPYPDRHEFDLQAVMKPAKEVGGDFYDFFLIDHDHLALVAADVSGKGVPAALFMMLSKTMLKTAVQLGFSPAGVLEKVNEQLAEGNDDNMFVTVWLGILEISTGKLTCADAGHENPVLCRNARWEILSKKGGMALGMMEPMEKADPMNPRLYHDQIISLQPGDIFLQYTDGVPEACDGNGHFWGEENFLSILNGFPSSSPDRLLPYILDKLRAFTGNAPQFDDITLLCLRYNGSDSLGSLSADGRQKTGAGSH